MCFHSQARQRLRRNEQGYILLTLLLIIALMIIFTAAIVPSITFEIKRDREEEMIHRGVQYSRAIRAYYKKFGRYPVKIEDLESANNLRFLRKRYKDPITGKDFKLLHFGEVKLTFSGGIGGAGITGANPMNNPSPFGSQVQPPGGASPGGLPNSSPNAANPNNAPGNNSGTPSDQNQNANPDSTSQTPGEQQPGANTGDKLSSTTFGGGPIVGVASSSKKETIREFNHKKKYNEWQFIYDPATDRGGLLMTPNQPQIQGFGQQGVQNVNGQNPNGQNNGAFGNSTGVQPGLQNNPNPSGNAGPGATPEPNNPPQPPQQQ